MAYPATLQIKTPQHVANWRPLVQWLLAVPHYVVLWVLGFLSTLLGVIGWLMVVVTGRLPAGIAGFQMMDIRYNVRVNAYASFLTTQYPSFDFTTSATDPGGSQITANFSPALAGRNRLKVFFRLLLMIPALLFLMIVEIVATICGILAFFAVLFTGRWPAGLHRWVVGALRANLRFNAYVALLNDDYPPFTIS